MKHHLLETAATSAEANSERQRADGQAAATTVAAVRAYWDRYAERVLARANGCDERSHFERLDRDHQTAYRLANRLLQRPGLAGRSVLELGCGMGFDTIVLARAGAHVVAVDLSEKCLQLTHQRLSWYGLQADLRQQNAERLDLPAEHFDLVLARGLLMFTPDPAAVVAEVHRVLRPGGKVQAILHHKYSWYVLLAALSGSNLVDPVEDPRPNRLYTRRQARALFCGFTDVAIHPDRLPTMPSHRPGWAAALYNKALVPCVRRAPRQMLSPFGYYLIAEAARPAAS